MKKIISIMLAVVLLLGVLPIGAMAVNETGLSIPFAFTRNLDQMYSREWTSSNEDDKFYNKVTISERGFLSFYITRPIDSKGEFSYYDLTLYDASTGDEVWNGTTSQANKVAFDCTFRIGLPAGTYCMNIAPGFYITSGTIDCDFKFSFTADANCELEPNNTLAQATPIVLDTLYGGDSGDCSSSWYGDYDYYKIAFKANSIYQINIGNYKALKEVKVVNPANQETSTVSYDEATDSYFIRYGAIAAGTYSIVAYAYGTPDASYTLQVEAIYEDTANYGDKTGLSTAAAFDGSMDAEYTKVWTKDNNDLDCYSKITMDANGILTTKIQRALDDKGEYGNYEMTIYSADGTEILTRRTGDVNKTQETVSFDVGLAKGEYYVDIKPTYYISNGAFLMKYSFSQAAADDITLAPNTKEATATPIEVNKVYRAFSTGSSTNEFDYFKISLKAGENYRLYLSFKNPGYWSVGSEHYTVAAEDGERYYQGFSVDSDGEYYIKAEQYWIPDEYTIEVHSHTLDAGTVTTPATCTKDGVKTYSCTKCSYTKTEKIEKTGHMMDEGKITTPATCTEDGVKTYSCTACDYTKTEEIEKTGHVWDDGAVTKAATNSTAGEKTFTCTVCGETKTESIPKIEETIKVNETKTVTLGAENGKYAHYARLGFVPQITGEYKMVTVGSNYWVEIELYADDGKTKIKGGYNPNGDTYLECDLTAGRTYYFDVGYFYASETDRELTVTLSDLHEHQYKHSVISATCTTPGSEYDVCSICGEKVRITEIPALGHTPKTIPGKAATCTETGLTEGSKCSVCGEIISAQQEIPMIPHDLIKVEGKAPTCTEPGLSDGTQCRVCGKVTEAQVELPALGGEHSYQETVTTPATCTQDGVKTFTCSVCGASYEEPIAQTGHVREPVPGKAATCTEAGLTDGEKCSVCGEILKAQKEIPALGHIDADGDGKCDNCGQAMGLRGDANLDGKVLANDARLVLRASAKLETLEGQGFINCDLNGDGKLLAGEARKILRFSAKLETEI